MNAPDCAGCGHSLTRVTCVACGTETTFEDRAALAVVAGTRRARPGASGERSSSARAREFAARDRLATATERDHVAAARDLGAEEQDAISARRDHLENLIASRDEILARAAHDRARAAADRERAAADRAMAAADRDVAATERAELVRTRAASTLLLHEAATDQLTGARTRFFGLDEALRELERAHRTAGRLALAFVDVDGLKQVNDAHGHLAGDRLLQRVGQTLRKHLRPYDVIVRYGGDEFICLLSHLAEDEARVRFASIAASLAACDDEHSISFGLAESTAEDTLDALIARADADLIATRGPSARALRMSLHSIGRARPEHPSGRAPGAPARPPVPGTSRRAIDQPPYWRAHA